jgi:hypothetical protein
VNFGELKTRVEKRLGRSDLNSDLPDLINLRQKVVCRFQNFSWMRTTATTSTENGVRSYAMPGDYKDDLLLQYQDAEGGLRDLDMVTELWATHRYDQGDVGEPVAWVNKGSFFDLYPKPDGAYTLRLTYYAYPADLSADSDQNYLTTEHPDLLIAGASAEAFIQLGQYDQATFPEAEFRMLLKEACFRDARKILPDELSIVPRPDAQDWDFKR